MHSETVSANQGLSWESCDGGICGLTALWKYLIVIHICEKKLGIDVSSIGLTVSDANNNMIRL